MNSWRPLAICFEPDNKVTSDYNFPQKLLAAHNRTFPSEDPLWTARRNAVLVFDLPLARVVGRATRPWEAHFDVR